MTRILILMILVAFTAACSGDDKSPKVGSRDTGNNENNVDTPDAGDDSPDTRVSPDTNVTPDGGGTDDLGNPPSDVGTDAENDAGGNDMGTSCNDGELRCDGSCAICPPDMNVDTYMCMADVCVVATCDIGFEVCPTGCCTPAGPAMTGGVSMQSFSALDTSIDLDSNDYPRISYRNFFNTNIEVAAWNGRQWIIEPVDVGMDPANTSLAVDGMDVTHVAWLEAGSGDLKYARRGMAGWQVATVEATGFVGTYPSLAVDAMNRPHISYQDFDNKVLKYARWTGSAWMIETVDPGTGNTGYNTSLELDSMGRPAIAYGDFDLRAVRMARFNGAAWTTTTVETTPAIPGEISLALDPADGAHISWRDAATEDLRYVRRVGPLWVGEVVDAFANYGYSSTIALDSSGYPRILYHDATTDDVRYAAFDGLTWQIQDLSATENIGPQSSMVLDDADGVHISLSIKTPPVQLRYLKLP